MSKHGRSRGQVRPQAKGYSEAGASFTRRAMKGFTAQSGSPSEDIDRNNMTLRQRARMLYMSSPVATAAINTNRTKVVGMGLTLESYVDTDTLHISPALAKAWQQQAEAEFHLWADDRLNCDALGLNNFSDLQQLAFKSWFLSGDAFVLIKRAEPTPLNPYSLRLQVIEADRIRTPVEFSFKPNATVPDGYPGAGHDVRDGVEIDDTGRVIAYYVHNNYPGQPANPKKPWVRVEAVGKETGLPNILPIMASERPDQYRGVPYLAQVIEPLLQLRRYTEAELTAAVIQSFFTAWIETEADTTQLPISNVGSGVPGENPDEEEDDDDTEYNIGPGTVIHLKKGEKVHFGDPNIPTAGFETFVRTNCKLIGAALEIPYDVLIKEFNSSYSASRGALLEAYEAFKMRRRWFVDCFCRPVYQIFLSEAVALGRLKAPGFFVDPLVRKSWCGAEWIGPVQGQLDPLKEVKAATEQVKHGFKSHEQITREMGGGDWADNVQRLKDENKQLRDANGKMPQTDPGTSE